MSENSHRELWTSVSRSDDESVSLLPDMNGHQNTVAVEDAEKGGSHTQGVIVPKEKLDNKLFPLEKVKGVKCNYDHSSVANQSTSQSANVSSWKRIPNKTQVLKRNEKGETVLFKACRRKDLAQVKMLIQAGINVNVADYAGWTALHDAVAAGDRTVVEELLKAGAIINTQSLDGSMPLHDAVFSGHYQVVKLFLQSGSRFSDRNISGLTALEVAEKNIIDLLSSLPTFSGLEKLSADQKEAETSCQTQLFCKTGLRSRRSYLTNVPSRASGNTEVAREPGDIQLGKKDRTGNVRALSSLNTCCFFYQSDVLWCNPNCCCMEFSFVIQFYLRHLQAITVILNAMERIQSNMSSWPLTSPEDEGRYYHSLTQIEGVLNKVLTTQHLGMDKVAQKSRGLSGVRKLMWKNQLASLVSHQRNLVKILEKQMQLIETYVNLTAKTSRKERGTYPHSGQFRQNPPRIIADKRTTLCTNGKNVLIESQCNKNSTSLLKLIKSGVMPRGGALRMWIRERWHYAHVDNDGSIRDKEGKIHLTPEQWVESIFGNNIPISSQYARDRVLFRGKHLSHYLSSLESNENTSQTYPASSQRSLDTEADSLTCLMKINMIHLVDNEEMLPNAVMDYHWEKLLKTDYSVTKDWDS
ncbi:uncharacterized protein LOC103397367 isoform X2 [Cynoglossus semilaevis]|uniref:uncharacterized protein LOC103397367 isoform X2 n=1 Tax=Cynoglossus semilaevis TaxID=244447 RepID=UPI000497E90E|nr:uncharacterized protein LOC103397367 isoform X2 [Cynoglossus semilaevis]